MLRLQVAHPPPSTSRICWICTSAIYRRYDPAKRPLLATPAASERATNSIQARRPQPAGHPPASHSSWSPSAWSPASPACVGWASRPRAGAHVLLGGRAFSLTSTAARSRGGAGQPQSQTTSSPAHNAAATAATPLPPLEKVLAPVLRVKKEFLGQAGIPTERSTLDALRTCDEAARVLLGAAVPPQLSALEVPSSTSTSALLSLDGSRGGPSAAAATASAGGAAAVDAIGSPARFTSPAPKSPRPALGSSPSPRRSQAGCADPPATTPQASPSRQLNSAIDSISQTAHVIVSLPAVFITPKILELYVGVQSCLGRPETLPEVLSMYASKPVPQAHGATIKYLRPNPDKPANAVSPSVAETALDAAIEAGNLDAAVAIIDSAYATKAFVRSKLLRKALVPASCFAALPVCLYMVASGMSHLQHTMDQSTATAIAFAGVTTYVGFTSAIGLLATATGNDHMKRVTWAPGTPLTRRWIREEERAALDRVVCSFGFSESHRYGEEEGAEFEALREYILRKGMILDQVELMEGMRQ
ncbi:hypothetical protein MAPG_03188 [Magnaporthiopsis poae ATCC 64411]|uniref:Uncharacterized protein n=1 Tax=Magnaporthiopsis poae (strain ATCC 64411 / 73-15) TaxID=644358 RepID=A0A0C4DTC4_MAGP6|nr:hypothetical protein MAPG_03188 [Magnaporthiopsis poae ATCC 64411]